MLFKRLAGAAVVMAAASVAVPGIPSAQDFRLGNETRARKLSMDTVAGRRITLADGRWFVFRRDGSFSRSTRDGDTRFGTWSIAYENVINVTSRRGETRQLFFVTVEGKLYLRNAERGGRLGRNAESVRVVNIEAAD